MKRRAKKEGGVIHGSHKTNLSISLESSAFHQGNFNPGKFKHSMLKQIQSFG